MRVLDNIRPGKRNGPGRMWKRALDEVDTVCLHQTGVLGGFGVTRKRVLAVGPDGAFLERFWKVPYHFVICPIRGLAFINNAPEQYTYHGNGANAHSVGVAVDGMFPGDHFDPAIVGGALSWAVRTARELGCPIKYVTAHGMWSSQRLADPGLDIWRCAMDALEPLGVELDPRGPANGGRKVEDLIKIWSRGAAS